MQDVFLKENITLQNKFQQCINSRTAQKFVAILLQHFNIAYTILQYNIAETLRRLLFATLFQQCIFKIFLARAIQIDTRVILSLFKNQ